MSYTIHQGNCLDRLADLPAGSVQTCVSSPPYYGLRNYQTQEQPWPAMSYVPMAGLPPVEVPAWTGELGGEPTPAMYVAHLVAVYAAVHRVLADDGTIWVNLGDSYSSGGYGDQVSSDKFHGHKPRRGDLKGQRKKTVGYGSKQLLGIPWKVAFALQAAGWVLRQDIIWHKPNPMPEPVKDRCTKAHEYLFLLSKKPDYYFNHDAIQEESTGREPGNTNHKHTADYQAGNEQSRLKAGLLDYAKRKSTRPRVNETERKALRTDTESRHRSSIPGGQSLKAERPQLLRARELAEQHGLTEAHLDAIRACGLTDTGKNAATQTGTGKNDPAVQALAAEAKEKLGGYYREFLLADTRNKRSVWMVATQPYAGAHFATFPPELIRPCILAGSRPGDVVLDPFAGSGTTLAVAVEEGRTGWGIELNPAYLPLIHQRLSHVQMRLQFTPPSIPLAA